MACHLDMAQTGRWRGKEPLITGWVYASQPPPAGGKGASELQELRAEKCPGRIQGNGPLDCLEMKIRARTKKGRTLIHLGESWAWATQ